jgi:hypothetical protein
MVIITVVAVFLLGVAAADLVHTDGWVRGIAWFLVANVLGVILGNVANLAIKLIWA